MKPLQRQRGLTTISIIIILGVLAFFVAIVLTLFPIYMEHFSVTSHLKSLKKESDAQTMTSDEIMRTMMRRLEIDNVKHVTQDDIEIDKEDNKTTVVVDYEVREHFLGNIDIVAMFHDEVEIPQNPR